MEALLPLGIVKAIGVSNFTITKLEALLPTVSVIPAVNQGTHFMEICIMSKNEGKVHY